MKLGCELSATDGPGLPIILTIRTPNLFHAAIEEIGGSLDPRICERVGSDTNARAS